MATSTTRLALRKPDPSVGGDNINVALDLNGNWDKVDAVAGFTVCTSGTRPNPAWQGQPIYETDTGKAYVCTIAPSTWSQMVLESADFDDEITADDFVIATGTRSVTSELNALNAYPAGLSLIAENILASAASSVTFSSIPATFRSLELRMTARSNVAAAFASTFLRFNGDTGANYDHQQLFGQGGTAGASEVFLGTSISIGEVAAATAPSGQSGIMIVQIPFYRNTAFWKSLSSQHMLSLGNASTNMYSKLWAGRWRSTSAVTSVTIGCASGSFITDSSFSLYGLR